MTDLEISKALALTIGWPRVEEANETNGPQIYVRDSYPYTPWSIFDYRDWAVIGPIAERYACFPYRGDPLLGGGWVTLMGDNHYDTPQEAIAMAVIEGVGK